MSQPATAGTNLHVESIPPSPNAWFVVDTVAGNRGVHNNAAIRNSPDATGAPNSAGSSVQVTNQYYMLSNPA